MGRALAPRGTAGRILLPGAVERREINLLRVRRQVRADGQGKVVDRFIRQALRKRPGCSIDPARSSTRIVDVVEAMIGFSPASREVSASASRLRSRISGTPSKMTSQRGNAAAASCRGTIVTRSAITGTSSAGNRSMRDRMSSVERISARASAAGTPVHVRKREGRRARPLSFSRPELPINLRQHQCARLDLKPESGVAARLYFQPMIFGELPG